MPSSFRPAWWLPGAHAQTVWGKSFRTPLPVVTTAEQWETPDGDHLTIVHAGRSAGAPLLVLLHGLEGSMHSHYANALLAHAPARGWSVLLVHFRTCDGKPNKARRTYHSGETTDLDFVVRRIIAKEPDQRLCLAGVSLGANVLLKWLGEQEDRVPSQVKAAVAVSTPFDLARSSRRINQGFSRLYQRHFVAKLRRKALAKLRDWPDIGSHEALSTASTFWEFDDRFTAPVHGFRDASDYYERSSSIGYLHRIRVRTLLLSARDDPFHPADLIDDVESIGRSNPALELEFPDRGGHVGFVEGQPWNPRYYLDRRVFDFLDEALGRKQT